MHFNRARAIVVSLFCVLAPWARCEDAPYTTDAAGFIPYWIGLGPIPVTPEEGAGKALDVDLLKGEATCAPVAGDKVTIGNRDFVWKPVSVEQGTPMVDGGKSFGKADNVVMYLVAYVKLARDEPKASVFWGSDDSGAIRVNGREFGRYVGGRPLSIDSDCTTDLPLKKGVNTVMLKVVNGSAGYFGCARLVGSDSRVMAGVTLAAAPEGRQAPEGAPWTAVDTGRKTPAEFLDEHYLVAGQIGYNANEDKMAIAASKRNVAWTNVAVCDAATGKAVFRVPQDGGWISPMGMRADVGQCISRVYFGAFDRPGRYYLQSEQYDVTSLPFDICDDVFVDTARACARAFYFQRYGQAFDAPHAGPWASPPYHDTAMATNAMVYEWSGGSWLNVGSKVLDSTPRDVRGGWYDAGDPNKYTKNECLAHNVLLMSYELNRPYVKDGDLNLPESGNGVPDLVDEARYTTEYLMRIQREDGAVFDRVAHGDDRKGVVRIAEPCSGATLCAIGSLAWAGAVWKEGGWDKAFAARCIAAAEKSWTYMQAHPSPWPVDANGKPRGIGSIDGGYAPEEAWRNVAAAALFRATGKDEYRKIAEDSFEHPVGEQSIGRWIHQIQVCHNYMLAKSHDPEIVARYGRKMAPDARRFRDAVARRSTQYAYGAGWPVYCWSSNSGIGQEAASMAWWATYFAPKAELADYAQAADEYLQYLLGRNPVRWCYVTNLKSIGAERSCQVMFHFLCRHSWTSGTDNPWLTPDRDHPNRTGCYPGYLVGGPMPSILSFGFDPYSPSQDYVHMEPSIVYQCHMVALANYCALRGREHRALRDPKTLLRDDVAGVASGAPVAAALPQFIAPSNALVRYVGRFDCRQSDGPRCAWAGSAVAVRFKGTALNALVRCSAKTDCLQVVIDGKPDAVLTVENGKTLYRVADGLPAGTHTVELFKRTEPLVGAVQFLGFQLEQGASLVALPKPKRPRKIEFIGDSITAGYGNEADGKERHFEAATENNTLAYGAIAARELGADYACVAWSGKCLAGDNSMPALYGLDLPDDPSSTHVFSAWIPDVVLINLGTNDFGGGKKPDPTAWAQAYADFILTVRKHYPKARVYCALGPMINDADPYWHEAGKTIKGIIAKMIEALAVQGQRNVSLVEFDVQKATDGYGADWHPSLKTHRLMADRLEAVLAKDVGWKR